MTWGGTYSCVEDVLEDLHVVVSSNWGRTDGSDEASTPGGKIYSIAFS